MNQFMTMTSGGMEAAGRGLEGRQNLPVAMAAGAVAALGGAVAWAALTVATHRQIGWMAIGVGFLVGQAVRLGKGVDRVFGVLGGGLALLGCVFGNLFTLVGFVAIENGVGLWEAVAGIDFTKVPGFLIASASPIDLLFYVLAGMAGYRHAFRRG